MSDVRTHPEVAEFLEKELSEEALQKYLLDHFVTTIADMDPIVLSGSDGDMTCVFCGGLFYGHLDYDHHTAECIWHLAKTVSRRSQ